VSVAERKFQIAWRAVEMKKEERERGLERKQISEMLIGQRDQR
jgi:hypothetical protein